jgi:hypothetical protein
MITGAELGHALGHHPYRHQADASRAAQRLGMGTPRNGPRRFTLGQVVAVIAIEQMRGPLRTTILEQVPDLVDHEHARWISLVWAPGAPRVGWGPELLDALEDLGDWQSSADLVQLINVDGVLALIAQRIGRPVTVPA